MKLIRESVDTPYLLRCSCLASARKPEEGAHNHGGVRRFGRSRAREQVINPRDCAPTVSIVSIQHPGWGPHMNDDDECAGSSDVTGPGEVPPESDCGLSQDRAPELACGLLAGAARTEALAHLRRCGSCQDAVSGLALTADRLVDLVPERHPPAGFEHRVLTAIASASKARRSATGAQHELSPLITGNGDNRVHGNTSEDLVRVAAAAPRANQPTLAVAGVLAAACTALLVTNMHTTTTSRHVVSRQVGLARPGQHHQRLDGWSYVRNQQRAGGAQVGISDLPSR